MNTSAGLYGIHNPFAPATQPPCRNLKEANILNKRYLPRTAQIWEILSSSPFLCIELNPGWGAIWSCTPEQFYNLIVYIISQVPWHSKLARGSLILLLGWIINIPNWRPHWAWYQTKTCLPQQPYLNLRTYYWDYLSLLIVFVLISHYSESYLLVTYKHIARPKGSVNSCQIGGFVLITPKCCRVFGIKQVSNCVKGKTTINESFESL